MEQSSQFQPPTGLQETDDSLVHFTDGSYAIESNDLQNSTGEVIFKFASLEKIRNSEYAFGIESTDIRDPTSGGGGEQEEILKIKPMQRTQVVVLLYVVKLF